MSNPMFAAARMVWPMVGREKELEHLKNAMCRPGRDTRVVIIKGTGGIGKTRLLREALARAGHPNVRPAGIPLPSDALWNIQETVIVSDLLDFTEVRLHTSNQFMEALRDALYWHEKVEFPNYDAAVAYYKRKLKDQADFFTVKEAADRAHKAFFKDYKRLAENHRLVWALDTAEQLQYIGASWLLEEGLLNLDDLNFSTQQRLFELLAGGQLPNTTLIIVGRPEAEDFFNRLEQTAVGNNIPFTLQTIELQPFTINDIQIYLKRLADGYQTQPQYDEDIAATLQAMTEDKERAAVLHLYTGGQPVRLALFVDILAEGKQEPEALQDTLEEAYHRVGWDKKTGKPDPKKLKQTQFEIEEEFINLIFAGAKDLRSQILTALVRAHRGLDVDRLHFILDSRPNDIPEQWEGNPSRRKEIEEEINPKNPHSVRHLSFVKEGSGGRLILQDELYRIFDNHMTGNETTRRREADIRRKLYRKLKLYAQWEIARLKKKRADNRREDEKSLRFETPARSLSLSFYLSADEELERAKLEERILETELERLHYQLRIDPDEGFNDAYDDLAEQMWRAGNQEADAQIQIELWRFLRSPYTPQFIDLKPRRSMVPHTTPWETLQRTAQQDDITRWMKRFFLQKNYKRVLTFYEGIENVLGKLPKPLQITLRHTFSQGERFVWYATAQIYLGRNVSEVMDELEGRIKKLETLLSLSTEEKTEDKEFGFQGHPAEIGLRRVIGIAYTTLGYGHTTLGKYRQAAQAYAKALRYLRDSGFHTQEAVTRNNLSRVLSELGLVTRGVRICRDALALREELGYENPIAYSHSTLALI